MRHTLALLILTACPGADTPTNTGSTNNTGTSPSKITRTGWALGYYFQPEYVNGTGPDQPPRGISFATDGTWSHTSNGVIDKSGKWSYSASNEIVADGATIARTKNCAIITFEGNKYYRDDAITGCPDPQAALTPVEKCLLGDFEETTTQNLNTTRFLKKRTSTRLEIFEQIYEGSESAHYTVTNAWSVVNGQMCFEGGVNCFPIDWAWNEGHRKGGKDSGCVLPEGADKAYCDDTTGIISSGAGCQTWNRSGPTTYTLDCDDTGASSTPGCRCFKGASYAVMVWGNKPGDSGSCGGTTQLWKDCCGK